MNVSTRLPKANDILSAIFHSEQGIDLWNIVQAFDVSLDYAKHVVGIFVREGKLSMMDGRVSWVR